MDPESFLELAKGLYSNETAECAHRTAVSRAYYAAFHVVKRVLSREMTIPNDATAHTVIVDHLRKSTNTNVQFVGGSLGDLRKKRNRADYELNDKQIIIPATNVAFAIHMAEAIIATIEGNKANLGI